MEQFIAKFEIELIICLGFIGHIFNYRKGNSKKSGREEYRDIRFHFGEGIVIGFLILLICGAPMLIDAIVHSESYFSGFIIILYLVALIAPLVVIFFGLILAGSGTMLYYWTTEPVSINQIRGAVNLEYKNNEYNNGIKP